MNPFNYNYGYSNPYQSQYNNVQESRPICDYVNGIEGAKGYRLPMGVKAAILLDSDAPKFYFKIANAMGQMSIQTFKFEEVLESNPNLDVKQPTTQFVSIQEFDKLRQKVDELCSNLKGDDLNAESNIK